MEHPGERGALTLARRAGAEHAAVLFRAVMLWPAAMFTMMHSWKHQTCIGIRDAVSTLGSTYRECLERNSGLPIEENRNLAAGAGSFAEPLRNPSPGGKIMLLRRHGLSWASCGCQVFDATGLVETRAGRHITMIYGMTAEGTAAGAKVKHGDPSDGARREMTVAGFVAQHETGFAMRPLSDRRLGQFSQIVHH